MYVCSQSKKSVSSGKPQNGDIVYSNKHPGRFLHTNSQDACMCACADENCVMFIPKQVFFVLVRG